MQSVYISAPYYINLRLFSSQICPATEQKQVFFFFKKKDTSWYVCLYVSLSCNVIVIICVFSVCACMYVHACACSYVICCVQLGTAIVTFLKDLTPTMKKYLPCAYTV